jgi:outer membrane protein OmpA-like peptidoglycan-associated protein
MERVVEKEEPAATEETNVAQAAPTQDVTAEQVAAVEPAKTEEAKSETTVETKTETVAEAKAVAAPAKPTSDEYPNLADVPPKPSHPVDAQAVEQDKQELEQSKVANEQAGAEVRSALVEGGGMNADPNEDALSAGMSAAAEPPKPEMAVPPLPPTPKQAAAPAEKAPAPVAAAPAAKPTTPTTAPATEGEARAVQFLREGKMMGLVEAGRNTYELAPVAPTGELSKAPLSLVYYDASATNLTAASEQKLDRIVSLWKNSGGGTVRVVGYNDASDAKTKDGFRVGVDRAVNAAAYLMAQGVPSKSVLIAATSETATQRASEPTSVSAETRQRRVEVFLDNAKR